MKRNLPKRTGNWTLYKSLRNRCSKELGKQINDFQRTQFEKMGAENDSTNLFRTTRNLLGWKSGGMPKSFLSGGRLVRRPLWWLTVALERWKMKGKLPKFKFRDVTESEVVKMIAKLSNSTSFGIDFIDALAIKAVTGHLVKPLKHLINTASTPPTAFYDSSIGDPKVHFYTTLAGYFTSRRRSQEQERMDIFFRTHGPLCLIVNIYPQPFCG